MYANRGRPVKRISRESVDALKILSQNADMRDAENIDRRLLRLWIGDRSLDEAAEALGTSRSFLHDVLNGRRELSFAKIHAWAPKIGISRLVLCQARFERMDLVA